MRSMTGTHREPAMAGPARMATVVGLVLLSASACQPPAPSASTAASVSPSRPRVGSMWTSAPRRIRCGSPRRCDRPCRGVDLLEALQV